MKLVNKTFLLVKNLDSPELICTECYENIWDYVSANASASSIIMILNAT